MASQSSGLKTHGATGRWSFFRWLYVFTCHRDDTVFDELVDYLKTESKVQRVLSGEDTGTPEVGVGEDSKEDQSRSKSKPRTNGGRRNDERFRAKAYELEVCLLKSMSRCELVARIQALRQNLREMMVERDFNDLIQGLDRATKAAEEGDRNRALREEAKALLDRCYRRYVLIPKVERLRSQISRHMLVWVGLVTALLCVSLFVYRHSGSPGFGSVSFAYLSAIVAGSIGATVSTLRRLHQADSRRDPLMLWLSLERGSTSLWLSPILGALFGLIFLLLLRSGVVSGSVFPDFSNELWKKGGLDIQLRDCPGKAECGLLYREYTALLVWCFVAGWAERLIPDVLNRMASQARTHGDHSDTA